MNIGIKIFRKHPKPCKRPGIDSLVQPCLVDQYVLTVDQESAYHAPADGCIEGELFPKAEGQVSSFEPPLS
jgi:hypothetical protein